MTEAFRPWPLLGGGHVQTLLGLAVRSTLRWRAPSESIVVEAPDDVRLLVRASWQQAAERPALLLVHGLEGCDRSPYIVGTGDLAYRSGWHVVRMNMRGCGDSLELCARLYNASLTQDLLAVSNWLATRVSRFAIGAFSLGAGLSLSTLARERTRLPAAVRALVAVSPPLDMSRSADALERRSNWMYQLRFLRSLKSSYRKRQALLPHLYQARLESGLRTLRTFDDVITAHYGGFRDAEHYYRYASAGPRLVEIDRPTLVLAPANDPFITRESIDAWAASEHVTIEIPESGGHVGFVGRSRAPGSFWAADRMLRFLDAVFERDLRETLEVFERQTRELGPR